MNPGCEYTSCESHCFYSVQLRELHKKNKLGVHSEAKKERKNKHGSNPETTTSDGCHLPEELCLGWPSYWDWELLRGLEGSGQIVEESNEVLVKNSGFQSCLSLC